MEDDIAVRSMIANEGPRRRKAWLLPKGGMVDVSHMLTIWIFIIVHRIHYIHHNNLSFDWQD